MVEKTMPLEMIIIRQLELYVAAVYVKQSGDACSGYRSALYLFSSRTPDARPIWLSCSGSYFVSSHDSHDTLNG
jgi:hypothetical protein